MTSGRSADPCVEVTQRFKGKGQAFRTPSLLKEDKAMAGV